jgi:hypothetical protein
MVRGAAEGLEVRRVWLYSPGEAASGGDATATEEVQPHRARILYCCVVTVHVLYLVDPPSTLIQWLFLFSPQFCY